MSLKNLCITHFIVNSLSEKEIKLLPMDLREILNDIKKHHNYRK